MDSLNLIMHQISPCNSDKIFTNQIGTENGIRDKSCSSCLTHIWDWIIHGVSYDKNSVTSRINEICNKVTLRQLRTVDKDRLRSFVSNLNKLEDKFSRGAPLTVNLQATITKINAYLSPRKKPVLPATKVPRTRRYKRPEIGRTRPSHTKTSSRNSELNDLRINTLINWARKEAKSVGRTLSKNDIKGLRNHAKFQTKDRFKMIVQNMLQIAADK